MPDRLDSTLNQSPPYVDVDLFGSDRPLMEAVATNGAKAEAKALSEFGKRWGRADMFEQARLANCNPPELRADENGGQVVDFHPAYHRFMAESIAAGLHASTWRGDATPAEAPAEVARAARFYMVAQIENGHQCPVTMTRAAVAALATEPALGKQLVPKILGREYDPGFRPWSQKSTITLGMGMTEKQGGTDVRSNTTEAIADGEAYRITGHKWFMSAPMCDGFLVLAQAPAGLSCFFMPRFRLDGSVNGIRFARLKDKLGNRSNASSEVEFDDASALRVGEEGKGLRTILQMVQLTRLDCAISSAGMMRMALVQALHHCRHRSVFQRRLADQPMMRAVLADMALMSEAAVALVMRLCRSIDLAKDDALEAAHARLLTPAVKYWVCKATPPFVYEAMECLGGNGYVEDTSILPRLYREAPVNAIWEGSGNVMCLDVLRAMSRDNDAQAVIARLLKETKDLPGVAEFAGAIGKILASPTVEAQARGAVERLAELAAAAALTASAPAVAEKFARLRFAGARGRNYGSIDLEAREASALLERALPIA